MQRGRWLLLLGWGLLVPAPAGAQEAASVFSNLEGAWRGEGTLMGRSARFTMTWRQHEALAVLTFMNAFVDSPGGVTPVLHAAAVYRMSSARPEGVWLDSRGVRVEIAWEATDSSLVATWTAPAEGGRTTYVVRSPDHLEVVDEVQTAGGWRTFGTARYRRNGPSR